MESIKDVLIKKIRIVENHRVNVNQTDLHELMASIKQHGLKQAIGVSKNGKKDEYTLLFGQRRLLACEKLGWNTIPASVDADVSEEKLLVLNLTENMQRKDPSFAEFGRTINKLEERMGLSTSEVAARIGISVPKITQIKKVYEGLPAKYRDKVYFMEKGKGRATRKGMIPAGVATKIVKMKKDHGLKDKAIDGIFKHVVEKGADSMDLDNVGILMNSGMDLETSLQKVGEYKVYAFSFVGKVSEIQDLVREYEMPSLQVIFKKIMYGEIMPIKKPSFLPSEAKKPTKRSKKEIQARKNKRLTAMRHSINVQAKLGKLSESQAAAVQTLARTKIADLNEEQINQMEDIYASTQK